VATTVESVPREARETTSFYFYMAIVFVVIAFGGFARTYLIPVATNSFTRGALLHVHGILFLTWTILFAVQTRLVAHRRVETHRAVGLLGISLATAMFFMGVALAVRGLDYGVATGNTAAAQMLSIVSLSQISLFAGFFAAAIVNLRRPETHKRLMLLATANILTAAIVRWLLMLLRPDFVPAPTFGGTPLDEVSGALIGGSIGGAIVDLLVVAAMVRDWRARGRPHRVYVIGLAVMVVVQIVRPLFAQTELWRSIAGGIAALAG